MTRFDIAATTAIIGGVIAGIFGGWSGDILALIIFMTIDFITGICVAAFWRKSKKSKYGALSSKECIKGIIKKCSILLIVICAHYVDVLLDTTYIRNAVIIGFCASELISIMENTALMNILPEPVQKIFNKVIDVMKNEQTKR